MTLRRLAIAALAFPLLAGCVKDETLGTRPLPTGGEMFANYVALGNSLGAGILSGGINDSTQRNAYPFKLAVAMGLTPGLDWYYPSLTYPGCPPPYADIRLGTRIATIPGPSQCALRGAAAPYENNVSIPSIRVAQLMKITRLEFPATDTLALAQFITGSVNPVDMMDRARPTFVTLEVGTNDVLGAATRGDTLLLTSVDTFTTYFRRVADRIDSTHARVAVATVLRVMASPHFTEASVLFCLKTGLCPGVPATLPFSSPNFLVNANCAPAAAGGAGDTYSLTFTALSGIASRLAAADSARIACGTGTADTLLMRAGAAGWRSAGPSLNPAEFATVLARVTAFNTLIRAEATARGWAVADIDSALTSAAVQALVPPIPGLSATDPNAIMGTIFSQDGLHPTAAGQQILFTVFKNAINAKFGSAL